MRPPPTPPCLLMLQLRLQLVLSLLLHLVSLSFLLQHLVLLIPPPSLPGWYGYFFFFFFFFFFFSLHNKKLLPGLSWFDVKSFIRILAVIVNILHNLFVKLKRVSMLLTPLQTRVPQLLTTKKLFFFFSFVTNKNHKKKKKKKTVVFNSASCLLKAVHSLDPSPSATRSIATATGLTPGHAPVLLPQMMSEHSGSRRMHNDSDASADAVKRRRKTATSPDQACTSCGRTDSPEWRKGPEYARALSLLYLFITNTFIVLSGKHTLCNACGLRYARHQSKAMRKMNSMESN
jgi:hypothetical protein